MAKKPKSPARTGRAGKALGKIQGPDLIQHRLVADKLGVTAELLRDWVLAGFFPEPHSVFQRTWLYRVDLIEGFLATGKWPEGALRKVR